ncbi:DUF1684 domain-containing protein [Prauserella oleivorans]
MSARAGDGLVIEGRPVDGPTRSSIRQQRSAVCGSVGDVRLEVLRREGRYGIRVRDPGRRCEPGFSEVPAYPPTPQSVIPARFAVQPVPRTLAFPTSQPSVRQRMDVVGTLHFAVGCHERSLARHPGRGSALTVAFRERTSDRAVASWRVPSVPRPRAGMALLDFNRAFDPRCLHPVRHLPPASGGQHGAVRRRSGERHPR